MHISAENQTSTYIAQRIIDYLEQTDKLADASVLSEAVQRMRQVLVRDLMQPRDTRAGKESNTLYSGPCARKAHLTYHGAAREGLRARTVLKFMLGDMVEQAVLTTARLAGAPITDNNIDLSITGHDGKPVPVHPDGLYQAPDGTLFNIEIKSCDSGTYDRWDREGGPDDTWGYLTQASVEVQAWREYGKQVDGTLFLAVSTGSRIGSIAEYYKPFDPALVEAWHCRRDEAMSGLPPIPFASTPELAFKRGKHLNAEDTLHGEPTPRRNEAGAIYGWDIPTGRQTLPLVCSYCNYKTTQCWKTAQVEVEGTKPVWVVPASVVPGASQDSLTTDLAAGAGQPVPAPGPAESVSEMVQRIVMAHTMGGR